MQSYQLNKVKVLKDGLCAAFMEAGRGNCQTKPDTRIYAFYHAKITSPLIRTQRKKHRKPCPQIGKQDTSHLLAAAGQKRRRGVRPTPAAFKVANGNGAVSNDLGATCASCF